MGTLTERDKRAIRLTDGSISEQEMVAAKPDRGPGIDRPPIIMACRVNDGGHLWIEISWNPCHLAIIAAVYHYDADGGQIWNTDSDNTAELLSLYELIRTHRGCGDLTTERAQAGACSFHGWEHRND